MKLKSVGGIIRSSTGIGSQNGCEKGSNGYKTGSKVRSSAGIGSTIGSKSDCEKGSKTGSLRHQTGRSLGSENGRNNSCFRQRARAFALALLCTGFSLSFSAEVSGEAPEISARAAVVYAPQTGTTLYEKSADERMLVASTTKIMTAMVVLERCGLSDTVKITPEQAGVEGSSMYLRPGESYTVEDLLYGLLLASGNDAAAALAEHTAGSVEAFAELMNEKAARLGLSNSHFMNPHGLDEEGHYSSARDLALMTAAAMENETFREIVSSRSHLVKGVCYTNHNKLLDFDLRCTGGKTGYTEKAGRILVSTAESDGLQLICVTISDPDDWRDHTLLYDEYFTECRYVSILPEQVSLPLISGTRNEVPLKIECEGFLVSGGSVVTVRTYLPLFAFAPVQAGDRVGEVRVSVDGQERVIPVLCAESVFIDGSIPLRPWERLHRVWRNFNVFGVYYPQM